MFVSVFAVLSWLAGVGLGWLTALAGSVKIIHWLTVPTAAANVINVVFVPGAKLPAIDSVAKVLDLLQRDSLLVVATIGYHGKLLPELSRIPLDAEERLTTLRRVLASVLDRHFPENLRGVYDHPPLLYVSGALTAVPGISNYHCGGMVVYRNATKTAYLGVPRRVIDKFDAVSDTVAAEMARRRAGRRSSKGVWT